MKFCGTDFCLYFMVITFAASFSDILLCTAWCKCKDEPRVDCRPSTIASWSFSLSRAHINDVFLLLASACRHSDRLLAVLSTEDSTWKKHKYAIFKKIPLNGHRTAHYFIL